MLSFLLANPKFRRDMFHDEFDDADDGDDPSSVKQAEYLAASIFFGMLIGGTLLGFLSDHIGRRPALLAGLVINATAGLFSSFPFLTPTIAQLTAWRFLAGIGIGATVPSLFSLTSEWCPKEVRGAVVTFVASFWMVGSLFVSGMAWVLFRRDLQHDGQDTNVVPAWRIFAALCAMPSAIGAFMVYNYIPESPRFLASTRKKYDTSACVVSRRLPIFHSCHESWRFVTHLSDNITNQCNQMAETLGLTPTSSESRREEFDETFTINVPSKDDRTRLDSFSMHAIQPLTESELRHDHDSSIPAEINTTSSNYLAARVHMSLNSLKGTLLRLYSPQLLTRTTLPLQTIWFSLSFSSYGITTWINTIFVANHLQNIYFNSFLFALANLPGNVISIVYSDRWGRKRMLVGSLIGAAGGLSAFAMLVYGGDEDFSSKARTYGIVLSACIFQMFSIISWNAIDILTGELFPTRVRSGGMGVCTACGRFAAMFAQFVNAQLMMAGSGNGVPVLIVASFTLLVGAVMPMYLDEMALGELKDEILDVPPTIGNVPLGCISREKGHKAHMSDEDETIKDFAGVNEYESIQEDSKYRSLRQETFLL
jgi:MFS family permease